MNPAEENLQHKIEQGNAEPGMDARAYRIVFNALKKEPGFQLPSHFSQKVVTKLSVLQSRKESKRDLLLLILGIMFMTIALITAIVLTGFKFEFGIFKFLAGYKGLIIFGTAFLVFLNWLDKRLLKNKQTSF